MNKELINLVNNFEGCVLAIGINDKIADAIDKNNKILKCDILNCISTKKEAKKAKTQKTKIINIRKLRKIYKKKKVDYIICEYSEIAKYLNTFVKDSVYINSSKLYFYGKVNEELILRKYKRYTDKIKVSKKQENYLIEIDNTDTKNNTFKEFFYKIIDGLNNLVEIIGDVLMG